MTVPTMNKLNTVFPIMIDKYEQFIPNIEGMGVPDKINAIIQYLNRIGKLSNDVVADWNKVMVWVMDEGLNESVISKVDDLIAQGTFDVLLNGMFDQFNTSLSDMATIAPKPNGTNDTTALQTVLNKGGYIRIPDGTYFINGVNTSGLNDKPNGGLSIPSNTILELSPNTVIQAITTSSSSYSVIRVQDVSNVIIRGGTIKGERTTHTGTSGEWGYGIILNGSTNISIEDITIQDCWGDGIFVNAGVSNDSIPCKNVKIKGVVCDNNRRQGLSAQHVDGLYINGSRFSNTNGTAPQSGIDIEPFIGSYTAKNIKIVGCEFVGNVGDGVQVNGGGSQGVIDSCTFTNNNSRGVSIYNTTNWTISNNVFNGHTNTSNGTGEGIELNTVSSVSVIGNMVVGNRLGIVINGGSSNNTISGNTCTSNTENGIAVIGGNDNILANNVCKGNTLEGIYCYASSNINIVNNVSELNSVGIHCTSGSNNNQITSNYCRKNSGEGIKIDGSNHNTIQNNTCLENSQSANVSSDNILLFSGSYNNIQGNTCRKGSTTNLPRYGIFVQDTSSVGNLLMQNDCYIGGSNGGLANTGNSTLFGFGNRNNDGTFSTTPN